MNKFRILVFLSLFLFAQAGYSQIVWDDGLVHNIDTEVFNEPVHVYNSISSQPTIVNVFNLPEPEPGHLIPLPSEFASGLWLYDNSQVNITGGIVRGLYCNDSSNVSLSPKMGSGMGTGVAFGNIEMYGNSHLNMSDGFFLEDIIAYGNSLIEISGGLTDGGYSHYLDGSFIPGTTLRVNDNSQIIIEGIDFEIDGIAIGYGPIDFSNGELKGTLANGEGIHVNFLITDNASIVLIPEPATILLFGIGGLLLRRRN